MTMTAQPLAAFAEAIVHELRTPLSVIAGEVDLALARDRSPAAYRDALSRIAECVAELVDLTGDLALYGGWSTQHADAPAHAARLAAVVEALKERYGARRGAPVTFVMGALHGSVAGRGTLITGALSLLVEHAVRHRRSGSRVLLRAVPAAEGPGTSAGTIDFLLAATPGGFSPSTWEALAGGPGRTDPPQGEMRVQTAAGIIRGCGGSLALTTEDGAECVLIRLRAAPMRPDEADGIL